MNFAHYALLMAFPCLLRFVSEVQCVVFWETLKMKQTRGRQGALLPKSATKKRSLLGVNEHFEEDSNAVLRVRSN